RTPEDVVARRLADGGVHVIGIDALQSFWQRRSPRDVALELQRLTDALATTGLPVYIGGRGFGAETMAVAGEMMASSRTVAGIVLVDPGPTAFFEVEPPALALRPFGPTEWSTRAAVARLGRPTLCVAPGTASPASLLCGSLAKAGKATLAQVADEPVALAATIGRFVLRAPAGPQQ
ncbi:MAG TPA: AcvB/VirJ family lysyl-phosphatidylglycerol hydrolase, partial [Luteitalea sp.]|nr:AcvB/VirJ family lysyl-phosphatidylglycerol hydrolase [Luteitalea sp.]